MTMLGCNPSGPVDVPLQTVTAPGFQCRCPKDWTLIPRSVNVTLRSPKGFQGAPEEILIHITPSGEVSDAQIAHRVQIVSSEPAFEESIIQIGDLKATKITCEQPNLIDKSRSLQYQVLVPNKLAISTNYVDRDSMLILIPYLDAMARSLTFP